MKDRPDQENWDTLMEHVKQTGYGRTNVDLIAIKGFLTGWEEKSTVRGHKAPLRRIKETDDE